MNCCNHDAVLPVHLLALDLALDRSMYFDDRTTYFATVLLLSKHGQEAPSGRRPSTSPSRRTKRMPTWSPHLHGVDHRDACGPGGPRPRAAAAVHSPLPRSPAASWTRRSPGPPQTPTVAIPRIGATRQHGELDTNAGTGPLGLRPEYRLKRGTIRDNVRMPLTTHKLVRYPSPTFQLSPCCASWFISSNELAQLHMDVLVFGTNSADTIILGATVEAQGLHSLFG